MFVQSARRKITVGALPFLYIGLCRSPSLSSSELSVKFIILHRSGVAGAPTAYSRRADRQYD